MVDQTSQFYAILTNVGAAKQANADALGIAWKITQMGVGDANGTDPSPNASQKALISEWRRAPLNQLKVDDKDTSIIVAEQVIPADVGGKWIREIGLYDADGDLIAVANCAPTYKPLLSQGSGRTQVVRMNLVVSSTSNVQLKIDPAVVLATREWVTEELARQDFKHSVVVATTANIALSGLQAVDGVTLLAGNRVLVKNQTAAKDNGLYVAGSGDWTRASDADTSAKVTPGLLVLVEKGATNGDSAWQLVTDPLISLGVSGLAFEMAFGRSGVAAGTYRSVTVDKYGRVTAASNPTTVAGYGLTDVYTKAAVDSALALKAPLASPVFTGLPQCPTLPLSDNSLGLVNTKHLRDSLGAFGLGTAFTGAIPATAEELSSQPSGNYYYPASTSPYTNYAFVQRLTYSNNRGFELANIPYTDRLLLRSSNNDGTWRAPVEFAPLGSPAFAGVPTAPTAALGTGSTQLANTAFVRNTLAQYGIGTPDMPDLLNKDLNTVYEGGLYYVGTGCTHLPPNATAGYLQVWGNASNHGVQKMIVVGGNEWSRTAVAGVWSDWSTLEGVPPGEVTFFACAAAPRGYLKANGAAVSRAEYPRLFAAIGTTYGVGNGTTTFNVPDLRGDFIRALDEGRGADLNRTLGSWQDHQNASHTHAATIATAGAHVHSVSGTAAAAGQHTHGAPRAQNNNVGGGSPNFTTANLQNGDTAQTYAAGQHTHDISATAWTAGDHTHAATVLASGGSESRPRNVALIAYIKY
ncbi:phage tail-collar fiber domain-containing protein [Pseudomonas alloputida]|uniref:phage tail-collar fiber domain-containing protein n=1 Tax=Pseudomonas TaxID=286 RepID=UPI003EEF282E